MRAPSIHLNGTSGEQLCEAWAVAAEKLREAWHSVRAAAPNERDYYPQGDDAWREAMREYNVLLYKLGDVYTEVSEMYHAIEEQNVARNR